MNFPFDTPAFPHTTIAIVGYQPQGSELGAWAVAIERDGRVQYLGAAMRNANRDTLELRAMFEALVSAIDTDRTVILTESEALSVDIDMGHERRFKRYLGPDGSPIALEGLWRRIDAFREAHWQPVTFHCVKDHQLIAMAASEARRVMVRASRGAVDCLDIMD